MRILDWDTLDEGGRRAALSRPRAESAEEVTRAAQEVIATVRERGDAAVREFSMRFDGVAPSPAQVSLAEFAESFGAVSADEVAALKRAIANVVAFHRLQLPEALTLETEPGVRCEQLVRPIDPVGLYVPAGSAALPSTLIMLAVPAGIAGCRTRILCTPPAQHGNAHPAVLVAAQLCGIDTVFKVGGAQAIAALAYGTEAIPKVDKIFGPGNAWVTAAKQLVAQDPQGAVCDLPAGPSEVMVIADETARPEFVAADLLAQAEHDPLSQALLVTTSLKLAREVDAAIVRALPQLSRRAVLARSMSTSRALLVSELSEAFVVANAYAPEHLLLQIQEPRSWLGEIRNAGAVFLGGFSPEPLGDYCSGTNHVLPTYGYARALSGLTVRDFMKTICVQELTSGGLQSLGPTAVTLSRLEGLDAHALAVTRRLETLARAP